MSGNLTSLIARALCTTLLALAVVIAAPTTTARAQTTATIAPSLSTDRPGAKATLDFAIQYAAGKSRVPSPVRHLVVRLPAGLSLSIPRLRSCTRAQLLVHGASSCPAQSRIGRGRALMEVHAGSQVITENVALLAFLGPLQNGRPTVEILGRGYTPLVRRIVLTGSVLPDRAPYGEQLVMPIPPIPTLRHEPDAALLAMSLRIGPSTRRWTRAANTVLVPNGCPAGGLPFAAESTFADGSSASAVATVSCGRVAAPPAHTARTISLDEVGHLRLVSKHEFTLNERGSASGTIRGTISVRLRAVSTTRVVADVSIFPRGGAIYGHATASYRTSGARAGFSGTMSITRGSGSYAHAHGSGLSFSGTIQRSSSAVTVRMSGKVSG